MIEFDLSKRAQRIAELTKQDKLPKHWFPHYVVYAWKTEGPAKKDFGPYLVGLDSLEAANDLTDDLRAMGREAHLMAELPFELWMKG